jgi:probable F420-dependent oxidoreductase
MDCHRAHPDTPRVGLALAQFGAFADPGVVTDMAERAERLGYSSLWVGDRLLAPVAPRTPYPASIDGVLPHEQRVVFDPFIALALAAAVTDRVRLGTNVLVAPWYPPVLLARTLTAIDRTSNGRLTVGMGLGWSIDEYEAVGTSPRNGGRHLDEIIDVLEAVWADGITELRSERYHVAASAILPKPVQRPRPPILLAAYTAASLDRVARRADGWVPAGLPIEALAPMFAGVRDMAAGYGRDPDHLELVVRANTHVTERALGPDRPAYHGTVAQIADDVEATRRAGAHEIVVELQGTARTLDELFALAAAITEPVAVRAFAVR